MRVMYYFEFKNHIYRYTSNELDFIVIYVDILGGLS